MCQYATANYAHLQADNAQAVACARELQQACALLRDTKRPPTQLVTWSLQVLLASAQRLGTAITHDSSRCRSGVSVSGVAYHDSNPPHSDATEAVVFLLELTALCVGYCISQTLEAQGCCSVAKMVPCLSPRQADPAHLCTCRNALFLGPERSGSCHEIGTCSLMHVPTAAPHSHLEDSMNATLVRTLVLLLQLRIAHVSLTAREIQKFWV